MPTVETDGRSAETAATHALRATRLWRDAPEDAVRRAAARMVPRRFAAGDVLIQQGAPGSHLHVILSGKVEVRVRTPEGSEVPIAVLAQGECVGEMSLLTGDPASADVVAVEGVETLALGSVDFTAVVSADPGILRQFVRILSGRLTRTDEAVSAARGKEQDLTEFLREAIDWDEGLVAKRSDIRRLRRALEEAAKGDAPVMVRGEEGTGRGVVANLVHRASERSAGLVIGVDCTLIAETEWGDKLFGARGDGGERGRTMSYLDLAGGGTLVLKDLEHLPRAVQGRLAAFLEARGEGGGSPRRDVRVIATCTPSQDAADSDIVPELLACFEGRVVDVPPLRDRKRDIPPLAEHLLRKHAERLGKEVRRLDDQAIVRLVSYDYRIANDRELEQAIERAVILAEEDTVFAEEIFLGRPTPEGPGGIDLLHLPGLNLKRVVRVLPRAVRIVSVLFFAFILSQAFLAPSGTDGNLATTLVWSLWWPALVLSFFFAGRAWCAVCPMGLAAAMGEWGRLKTFRIPAWVKNHDVWFWTGGLFLIVWVEEATAMRRSPLATGILLVAILAGAAVTGALFPRRTWCRHLCPLGGLAGVCATSGLLELRPSFDVCSAKCKGHSCFKGDEHVPGCPMFNHVMFVGTNQHCILCMNCVESCPNDSPQLKVRLPGRELWVGATSSPKFGRVVLLLGGLLLGMAAIQHLEGAPGGKLAALLDSHRVVVVSLLLVLGCAVPLLLARPGARESEGRGEAESARFWKRIAAMTPLVTAGFVAYQIAYLPGLAWLNASIESGGGEATHRWISVSLLAVVRFGILAAGLLTSAAILWRIGRREAGEEAVRRKGWGKGTALPAALVGYWALLSGLMLTV